MPGRAIAIVGLALLVGCGGDGSERGPHGPPVPPPSAAWASTREAGPEPVTLEVGLEGSSAWSVDRRLAVRRSPGGSVRLSLEPDGRPLAVGDQLRFDARIDLGAVQGSAPSGGDQGPSGGDIGDAASLVLRTGERELARFEASGRWETHAFTLDGDALAAAEGLELLVEADDASPVVLLSEPWIARPGAPQPTVLLITSDTHRADHVSAINPASPIATPHLDSVAREGALFTNCFSAANNTNPSHIALLTGIHPRDVKIVNNRTRLHGSAHTLAERFHEAGYRTGAALSAFHLFDDLSGLGQGFDRMNATKGLARDAEDTLAVARDWIEDGEGAPLFLWIHLFDVHTPYEIPGDQLAALLEGRPDPRRADVSLGVEEQYVPAWLKARGYRDPEFVRALYAGEVRYLDGHLGEFFALPRVASATIAITADHGEGLGERDVWWSHFGVLTPMIHVPLILRGPDVAPGSRSSAPVRQIDIGRTLLDLQGLESSDFPGRDLRDALSETAPAEPRFAISGHGISASIEVDGWMLELFMRNGSVLSSGRVHPAGTCSLFHLTDDPLCENDRLLDEFERAKRLREALIAWLDNAETTGLNSQTYQITAAQSAKLEELGYSGGYESVLRWWAPEAIDPEWDSSPWNLAFQGDGDPSLLRR